MSKALAVIARITKTEQEMKRYEIIYLMKKLKLIMLRNCSLKISKFLLFICFLSLNSQLFAKEMKNCPEKFSPVGIKLTDLGKKQYKITITKSKFLKDALNNQSLPEHIA